MLATAITRPDGAAERAVPGRSLATSPNGQRISGERRAEGDERVRCMRVLGRRLSGLSPDRKRSAFPKLNDAKTTGSTRSLPTKMAATHTAPANTQPPISRLRTSGARPVWESAWAALQHK